MRGLDTNVLVAWILGASDDKRALEGGPFRVSFVALVELVWVFGKVYKQSRAEIEAIIATLLQTEGNHFENDEIVIQSLRDFGNGSADFADYLLMHDGAFAGCETTLTFDKRAARHPGFTLLTGG